MCAKENFDLFTLQIGYLRSQNAQKKKTFDIFFMVSFRSNAIRR